jgi:hypothetical protein
MGISTSMVLSFSDHPGNEFLVDLPMTFLPGIGHCMFFESSLPFAKEIGIKSGQRYRVDEVVHLISEGHIEIHIELVRVDHVRHKQSNSDV